MNTWPGLFKRCRIMELRESALSAAHAQVLGKQFFQILPFPTQPKAAPSDVFASVCFVEDWHRSLIFPNHWIDGGSSTVFQPYPRISFSSQRCKGAIAWVTGVNGRKPWNRSCNQLGLVAFDPQTYVHDRANAVLAEIRDTQWINVSGLPLLKFDPKIDMQFDSHG